MPELKYLLFLGCVIPYRISSYEVSARKVLDKLGVESVEMPEFNCCGFPLDPINHDMMLTLAARNLCMTLCNGCFGILNHVNGELKESKNLREKVNRYLKKIGMKFKGTIAVKHLIHVLAQDVGLKRIKETIQKPLNPLRVAQHIGCHVVRPAKYIGFDDPENPLILKNLIEATGAECLNYQDEMECCGAPTIGIDDKISLQLAREKLRHIRAVGAQALITVCPFCHMMYDLNQPRIERVSNRKFGIPVLHYPQLLGLAMLRVDATKIITNARAGVTLDEASLESSVRNSLCGG
jgi:heterodisulfide reductase subunit B